MSIRALWALRLAPACVASVTFWSAKMHATPAKQPPPIRVTGWPTRLDLEIRSFIFAHAELIRHVNDPEHPLTLEQLNVASLDLVKVDDAKSTVEVSFTPTIPHCSMATLIGLCIRVKLLRALPPRFKVHVYITPGTHSSEAAINKQLADKVSCESWIVPR